MTTPKAGERELRYPKGSDPLSWEQLRGSVSSGGGPVPTMSEAAFMENLIAGAKHDGWLVYHTHDSRRSAEGFPDLCLVRGHRCVWVECKRMGGTPTRAQVDWLLALARVPGNECYLWDQTDMEEAMAVLGSDRV